MRWTLTAAALMLAGCNLVVTPSPLFSIADQGAAPQPRLGVWRADKKADCAVDPSRSVAEWPACAGGVILQAGGAARYYDHDGKPPGWKTQSLLFVPGTPMIGQAEVRVAGDAFPLAKPFAYVGVRPTRTDDHGRIVAMAIWPVQCGPPAPGDTLGMTKSLLPGLHAKPADLACSTTDPVALRAAAAASQAWAPGGLLGTWIWVRESDN